MFCSYNLLPGLPLAGANHFLLFWLRLRLGQNLLIILIVSKFLFITYTKHANNNFKI